MKNKFIKIGAVSTAPVLSLISVISCSNDVSKKDFTYENMDWSAVKYFEATVIYWNDGDTFAFDYSTVTEHGTNLDGTRSRVRVFGYDTPEMSETNDDGERVPTTGRQYEIANAGTIFANEVAGAGSRVRVIHNGGTSYDRLVGSVFYGENFERNMGVELLMRGLAQPDMKESDVIIEIAESWSPLHYIAYPQLYAHNYAKDKKLGFWQYPLEEVYGTRGVGNWEAVQPGAAADRYKMEGFLS